MALAMSMQKRIAVLTTLELQEEVIDLTQESGHPRRTIQFSQEEQGVLASSDED
jgi:hypothetical protein